jgi:hypothetical protein
MVIEQTQGHPSLRTIEMHPDPLMSNHSSKDVVTEHSAGDCHCPQTENCLPGSLFEPTHSPPALSTRALTLKPMPVVRIHAHPGGGTQEHRTDENGCTRPNGIAVLHAENPSSSNFDANAIEGLCAEAISLPKPSLCLQNGGGPVILMTEDSVKATESCTGGKRTAVIPPCLTAASDQGQAPTIVNNTSTSGRRRRQRVIRTPHRYDPENKATRPSREIVPPKRMRSGYGKQQPHPNLGGSNDTDDSMWHQVVDFFTPPVPLTTRQGDVRHMMAAMDTGVIVAGRAPSTAIDTPKDIARRCPASKESVEENVSPAAGNTTYSNGHISATWMFQNRGVPSKPATVLPSLLTHIQVVQTGEFWSEWPKATAVFETGPIGFAVRDLPPTGANAPNTVKEVSAVTEGGQAAVQGVCMGSVMLAVNGVPLATWLPAGGPRKSISDVITQLPRPLRITFARDPNMSEMQLLKGLLQKQQQPTQPRNPPPASAYASAATHACNTGILITEMPAEFTSSPLQEYLAKKEAPQQLQLQTQNQAWDLQRYMHEHAERTAQHSTQQHR